MRLSWPLHWPSFRADTAYNTVTRKPAGDDFGGLSYTLGLEAQILETRTQCHDAIVSHKIAFKVGVPVFRSKVEAVAQIVLVASA